MIKHYSSKIKNVVAQPIQKIKFNYFTHENEKKEAFNFLFSQFGGVIIQNSGICNARCIFCPYRLSKSKKSIMSDDVFNRIIAELQRLGGGDFGFLCSQGEPTLDPSLIERIQKVRSIKTATKISMITNAINLDKIGISDLLNSGINSITVSTSGFEKEMYTEVYGNDNYERMFENLVQLLSLNNATGNKVEVSVGLRSSKNIFKTTSTKDYSIISSLTNNITFLHHYDDWNGQIQKSDLRGVMKFRRGKKIQSVPCMLPMWSPNILEDGSVNFCSCRLHPDLIIGNIMDEPLDKIFFGKKRHDLFFSFVNNSPPECCKNCKNYYPAYGIALKSMKNNNIEN